jgi:lysophospholipase L1-like esterase
VKNRGISGDITFGVLARLDEVLSSKPRKLFIMIGINDIARNIPDSVILFNYRRIIQQVQEVTPKTRIMVQSILPVNNEFTQFKNHQNKDAHILFAKKHLALLCEELKVSFVNLYPEFLNEEGKLDKKYTNDGLHLTGPGYIKWKEILVSNGYMK